MHQCKIFGVVWQQWQPIHTETNTWRHRNRKYGRENEKWKVWKITINNNTKSQYTVPPPPQPSLQIHCQIKIINLHIDVCKYKWCTNTPVPLFYRRFSCEFFQVKVHIHLLYVWSDNLICSTVCVWYCKAIDVTSFYCRDFLQMPSSYNAS